MRLVLQRVTEATVKVNGQITGSIDKGLLVLLGVTHEDTLEDIDWLVKKLKGLRIFQDEEGKMNKDLLQVQGEILVVSQFTLYASTKKGNRPSYAQAATPAFAKELYQLFVDRLSQALDQEVPTGVFGADMKVSLVNDGPVTISMDSKNKE